ncbi:sulfite exporter TauE/SafE family protein [Actinomycetospora aeridis]|uniref:Probable membrane transporter protein n=1 Tax=Actinomycetospora aeridis TaxID=3129231 RepID=A0ABU8N0D7_9PSEU
MTVLDRPTAPAPTGRGTPRRGWTPLRLQALLAGGVWTAWLVFGGTDALEALRRHTAVAATMVLGSLVGGGTSEGGGAIAFPMFTKVLGIPPTDARVFTFLVQSVGMIAASVVILVLRVPVERRVLALGVPAGVAGVVFSVTVLAPGVASGGIRLGFTVLLVSLGIALVVGHLRGSVAVHAAIPRRGPTEDLVIIGAGLAGGVLSGLVGVGENTVMFLVLVLLFRVSEKVATPTTVVLMAVVSAAAAFSHAVLLDDVPPVVWEYWLAAVPVVVVGAPLGAVLCRFLSAGAIRAILVTLIGAELVSTVLLVPYGPLGAAASLGALVLTTAACVLLARVRRYAPPAVPDRRPAREVI